MRPRRLARDPVLTRVNGPGVDFQRLPLADHFHQQAVSVAVINILDRVGGVEQCFVSGFSSVSVGGVWCQRWAVMGW